MTKRFAALLAITVAMLATASAAFAQTGTIPRLSTAKSWGYQLQHLDVAKAAASPYDVLVIDYSKDGGDAAALTPAELEQLKRKPDGSRRIVLSYMSVGEAESYRYYWKWYWGGQWWTDIIGAVLAPSWRGPLNREWRGNYATRFWQERWQDIIIGSGGYLERIAKAGFDGVYLDKIDTSIEKISEGRATAQDDMRTFVTRIAERGRALTPGFLVVPQNGEELLTDATYRRTIDGLGKEDLFFGEFKEQKANPEDVIQKRLGLLKSLTDEGKPVLAVEYIDDAATIAETKNRMLAAGLVPHFADRPLDSLRIGDVPPPGHRRRSK